MSKATSQPIRLALLAASPMHYQAPLYRRLAVDPQIDFTAIFASTGGVRPHEAGYGQPIAWDSDLLGGYRSVFLGRAERNPISGGFFDLSDLDVISHLARANYDVLWIHGYSYLTHQLAAISRAIRFRPLLIREEQTLLHTRAPWKTAAKSIWLRALFSRSYGLYIGQQNAKWFRRWGMPDSRMFFTPYSVDNDWLRSEAERLSPERRELRESFGIHPESGPVILMVGRMIPKKNPQLLVEAFGRVRRKIRCNLLLVGSGELERIIRAKVSSDAIPDVFLSGFLNQSQIAHAYAAADVFALPSIEHETWGLVVNEAMNFNLPILASSKVGCAADLVADGVNGFLFSPTDPGELAGRLQQLIQTAALRERLGAASGEMIRGWNHDVAARGVVQATTAALGGAR